MGKEKGFLDEVLGDIAEFYPGSKKQIKPKPEPYHHPDDEDRWDRNPRHLTVNGKPIELFSVGHLAKALGRVPVTIRKWEKDGTIPKATFRKPSDDPRGQRRLYSRAQIEGLVKIAKEEGLLDDRPKPITRTAFTSRAVALFRELAVS